VRTRLFARVSPRRHSMHAALVALSVPALEFSPIGWFRTCSVRHSSSTVPVRALVAASQVVSTHQHDAL
jgi:hypothetical protein